ncbi:uncharacterized protein cspp1a isoform 1-T2 [Synchiropus picturatus]
MKAERSGSREAELHHSVGGATLDGRSHIPKGEEFHHLRNGFRGLTAAVGDGGRLSPLPTMATGCFDKLPQRLSLDSPSRDLCQTSSCVPAVTTTALSSSISKGLERRNLENALGSGSEDSWRLRTEQSKSEERMKQQHHVRWADDPQETDRGTPLESRGVMDGRGAPENWWGRRGTLPLTSDASCQTEGPTMRTQGTQMSSKTEEAHSTSVLSFRDDVSRVSPEFHSDHADTRSCTPDTKDVSCDQPSYFMSNHTSVTDSCEAPTETESSKLDSYKLELKKQIEEKKRRKAEEEERMRLEEERDERRLAEQILQLQQQYEKEKQRESHSCKLMRDEWVPQ